MFCCRNTVLITGSCSRPHRRVVVITFVNLKISAFCVLLTQVFQKTDYGPGSWVSFFMLEDSRCSFYLSGILLVEYVIKDELQVIILFFNFFFTNILNGHLKA